MDLVGILDSIQQSLLRQSDLGKRLKQSQQPQESVNVPNSFIQPQVQPAPLVSGGEPLLRTSGATNPFLMANAPSLNTPTADIGVNKPLQQPMFVGYHDNKPIYGGGKVFLLA
jgi:hypothetical protein